MAAYQRSQHRADMEWWYTRGSYSDQELGELLGTTRGNINKIRNQLFHEGLPIEPDPEQRGKYRLPRDYGLHRVSFSHAEAANLYCAGRRMQLQAGAGGRAVASAVSKLASSLGQPYMTLLSRSVELIQSESDGTRSEIFRALLEGIRGCFCLRVEHRRLQGVLREYLFRPYQIEPSLWSDGLYVLGQTDVHGDAIVGLKIARIRRAVVTSERFAVPHDFEPEALLRYSWGIWRDGSDCVQVILRFNRAVVQRLHESVWHPLEQKEPQPDGSCLWRLRVSEWREMVPWIRGWGADCEVLEPKELRLAMRHEVQKMALLYADDGRSGGADSPPPGGGPSVGGTAHPSEVEASEVCYLPYAKTYGERFHLLLYHMVDVGAVAQALWEHSLSLGIRASVADFLGCSIEEAGHFIAFLAALHDLGKAAPGYQDKYATLFLRERLAAGGLELAEEGVLHGVVTAYLLGGCGRDKGFLEDITGIERLVAVPLGSVSGGHHGYFPDPSTLQQTRRHLGSDVWRRLQKDLFDSLAALFLPTGLELCVDDSEASLNAFLSWVAGLISVSDWIGSNDTFFPYCEGRETLSHYARRACMNANIALEQLGWLVQPQGQERSAPRLFEELCSFAPNVMQASVLSFFENVGFSARPALAIIEAPTGLGKTEIASYLAYRWLRDGGKSGLFLAAPTQATSNQMHSRLAEFLERLGGGDDLQESQVHFQLIHGRPSSSRLHQAYCEADSFVMRSVESHETGRSRRRGTLVARRWFLPKKRALLAPFGVGTVDQVLLSVLQTKHFFVRMFALGHKVVIFDEVHAYDTYMRTLFYRLLQWLEALGASVIVLSATLPKQTRREMVEAFGGDPAELDGASYPLLTVCQGHDCAQQKLPPPPPYDVHLSWLKDSSIESMVAFLRDALAEGGCAAVLCNTVSRAQSIYQELLESGLIAPEELHLFHARFPYGRRDQIERDIVGLFGKESPARPHRSIVVATQVIEQSLDLDFDVMVSELAPIDLLIQRAGRLHRHVRQRPKPCQLQRLALLPPSFVRSESGGWIPDLKRAGVYHEHTLLRTWLALRERECITIPCDTSSLIASVYDERWADPGLEELTDLLASTRDELRQKMGCSETNAAGVLIPAPGQGSFTMNAQARHLADDDDPSLHKTLRAETREIDVSVTLICLFEVNGNVFLRPDGALPHITEGRLSPEQVTEYLNQSVSVQNKHIVAHFLSLAVPAAWKTAPALRYCRPVVFREGLYRPQDASFSLRLSDALGLEYGKE